MSRRRPGNGSATLLDMLSNLFYFSLFLAEGEHREEERERKKDRKREQGRRLPKERQSAPSSTYLLPSAHVDAIFQYRVKRALPFSFTHPPTTPSSSRFVSLLRSFLEEKEKMEARHETRKREERSLVGGGDGGGERERGATASFGCNERTE